MSYLADDVDYPLLDVFWTMLWLFLWILWIVLFIRIIGDVFRSDDLSGVAKAIWVILLVLLPFLGAFIYIIARGTSMHRRDMEQAASADAALRSYIRATAGGTGGLADELQKLADLRDRGVITPTEFETQKSRLMNA